MAYTPPNQKQLIAEMFPGIEEKAPVSVSGNPCIALYGAGPEGAKCKTCKFLGVLEYSKNYYKCTQRKLSHSATTDHRVNWTACGKYEEGKHYTRE